MRSPPDEDLQVAVHMGQQVADHDQPADRHQGLEGHRRPRRYLRWGQGGDRHVPTLEAGLPEHEGDQWPHWCSSPRSWVTPRCRRPRRPGPSTRDGFRTASMISARTGSGSTTRPASRFSARWKYPCRSSIDPRSLRALCSSRRARRTRLRSSAPHPGEPDPLGLAAGALPGRLQLADRLVRGPGGHQRPAARVGSRAQVSQRPQERPRSPGAVASNSVGRVRSDVQVVLGVGVGRPGPP